MKYVSALTALLRLDELVIFRMASDPKPDQPIFNFDRQRSIVDAYPNGPKTPNFLEVKRWMRWILLEQLIVEIGQLTHSRWQRLIRRPK